MSEDDGFIALELTPAGAGPVATLRHRACRRSGFRRRSGCVPAEPYPPLKQPARLQKSIRLAMAPKHYSGFDRTRLSGFDRTTTGHSPKVSRSFQNRNVL
jgi:hypothetical protein